LHVFAVDVARNREHGYAPCRPARRVERTAASRSLNDDDGVGERCNDTVTLQELRRKDGVLRRVR
jgi:hypothetical protein